MTKKKETDPRQQTQSPESGAIPNSTDSILPDLPADVKLLRDFHERRRIPVSDQVEVVKALYPKYDRFLHSRCSHGEETGVMLRPDALKALAVYFAEDSRKRPSHPRRTKPNRLTCRVTGELYGALQRRLSATGQTMQEYLEALILKDLTGGNQ